MITVGFEQLHGWLTAFFWPFLRLGGFIAVSPLWGHTSVPNQVKIGLAALLAVAVAPMLPAPVGVPVVSWAGIGVAAEQIVIGLAMGMVMRVAVTAVQAAGEFIGLQMGLAFATFVTPDGANTVILSRILQTFTLLMLLALNVHLMVIETLALSFRTLPIGTLGFDAGAFEMLVRFGGTIFVSGMLLALPLVASLLIINLSLGILNRSAPQLTVFSVGFPTSLTLGVFLMTVLMTDLGRFLRALFSQALHFLSRLVEALAPLPAG